MFFTRLTIGGYAVVGAIVNYNNLTHKLKEKKNKGILYIILQSAVTGRNFEMSNVFQRCRECPFCTLCSVLTLYR